MDVFFYIANPGFLSIALSLKDYLISQNLNPIWIVENNIYQCNNIWNGIEYFTSQKNNLKNLHFIIGSQVNYNRTHYIIDLLKSLQAKVFFITDHWVNDEKNFIDNNNNFHLPDIIMCIDRYLKNKFINAGINKNILKIVGHPALEESNKIKFSSQEIKKKLGIKGNNKQIFSIFLEPLIEDVSKQKMGYDLYSILDFVFFNLKKYYLELKKPLIIIQAHPRQNITELKKYLKKIKSMSLILSTEDDARKIISISNKVIGITTIMLMHSLVMKKQTCSIQLNRTNLAKSKSNIYFENILIKNQESFFNFLFNDNKLKMKFPFINNSFKKVYQIIK